MKSAFRYLIAILILLIGFGGLLGYDLYFKPYILSEKVVKVKVDGEGYLPKNHSLVRSDLFLDSVDKNDIPKNAVREISQVENKILNVNISDGVILTESLVDVDDLEPNEDEGIFPIPKDSIYAINGSLRSRDKVNLYLIAPKKSGDMETEEMPQDDEVFLTNITVNYVRTDDNNDVQDTENGNDNNRFTSTGKVSAPELKILKTEGQKLKKYLEDGYKLWIVRVE